MKLLIVVGGLVGVAVAVFGFILMQKVYTHEQDLLFILKSGNENLSPDIRESNAIQAIKSLSLHAALLVLGVVMCVLSISYLLGVRKSHQAR